MSLDVSLEITKTIKREFSGIFIRIHYEIKEISLDEWNERNPWHTPTILKEVQSTEDIFSYNITHNLRSMAEEAGIYKELWRPEEIPIEKAGELIEPLKKGLILLKTNPDRFKKLNPENGWGTYEGLVKFVENYLEACIVWPDAKVRASR